MTRVAALGWVILLSASAIAQAQAPIEPVEEADEAWADRRLGPLAFTTGSNQLRVGMGVQVRSTSEWNDGSSTSLQLQRARPVFLASLRDGLVRFKLFLDVAPRALELIDAYGDLRLAGGHTLRVGIAKIPFTSHWDQSYLSIPFVDWPITTRWFGGGRQLGVSAMNDTDSLVSYALGIYTGQTLRPANGARFTTAYGGTRTNYLSLSEYTPLGEPHPEIVGRLMVGDDSARFALSAAWDVRPTYTVDEALRVALDGSLSAGPFMAWAGFFFAASEDRYGRWMGALGGALLEGRVRLGGAVDLAARYSAVFRSRALRSDSRAFADQTIDGSSENHDVLLSQFQHVGTIRAEHELTLAWTVYVFGNDLKWVSDASWLHTAGDDIEAFRLRSQVQLAF